MSEFRQRPLPTSEDGGVAREFGCSSPTRAFPRKRSNGEQGECINSIRTKAVASGTNCYLSSGRHRLALPPALLHIVLAGARTSGLGVPITLVKEAEAVVTPIVAARKVAIDRAALGLFSRNGHIDRRPAHQEAALGLVVE